MKVLFVGVGLTHYYNQVLNRLHQQDDIEIYNLVEQESTNHAGKSVYQTKENAIFHVIEQPSVIRKKLSDYSYRAYPELAKLLEHLRPEIIVVTDTYLRSFFDEPKITETMNRIGTKIILKDIPFRLDEYGQRRNRIFSGDADHEYHPFFASIFSTICKKGNIVWLEKFISSCLHFFHISSMYAHLIGRRVLLRRLEMKKRLFNSVDAHVDYIDDAHRVFESYDVPSEKIFIIRNSPDTDALFVMKDILSKKPPILPPNPHRLIHVGRLVEWKRVDLLIKAVKNVQRDFPDTELLIIGTGPKETELKNLASQYGISNSIQFLGGIYQPEELGGYLMASQIYILAGMGGISINEAMSYGLPVICSVCDGTEKKLVRDGLNGLYFRDGDGDDLTAKIRYMFERPTMTEDMGKNSTRIIRDEINIHTVLNGYRTAFTYVRANVCK